MLLLFAEYHLVVSPEYVIAGILTILTNLALLIFIISNRPLRTSKNAVLASGLVVGILFAAIVIPRHAILENDGKRNSIRDFRCGMLSRFGQALFLSLNLHLIAHVSEFYIQIVYPLHAQQWLNEKNVTITLAIIWSVTLLPPILIQIYLEIEAISSGGFHGKQCSKTFTTFFIITSIILAAISIIILIISSFAYAHVLDITNNAIKESQKILVQLSSNTNNSNIESSRERQRLSHLKLRLKSNLQAIIIYVCYLIPLLPFLVLVTYAHFAFTLNKQQPPPVFLAVLLVFQYMAYLFPAIQPIILFFFTAEFRNQFKLCRKRSILPN